MDLFRLMGKFFRVGVMNELQYRANFVLQLFNSLLALAVGLVGLALVFSYTNQLGGWSRPELLAVMGVHILMGGLIRMAIQPNMERLMTEIQDGTLDYVLTKPADAQILVSVREIRIWQAADVLTGLIVMLVAVFQMQAALSLAQALAFLVALLTGGLLIYSFWLVITSGAFWIVRVENIIQLFDGLYQAGRWPVGIYPDWLRMTLTFLVPVAFAVTVPAEAIAARLTPEILAGSVVLTGVVLALSRQFWKIALRHYSGASA
jgi:ABC-2 type transport system permease protein